ncbi:hypothetical protein [Bradyrhizobium sp. USDA 4504]
MTLLTNKSEQDDYSQPTAILQDNRQKKRSKNVPQRVRRSSSKDRKTIEKMRSFDPLASSAVGTTSLATPNTPSTVPSPTPLNDNQHVPVWSLVGDTVKAVAATAALQIAEKPAHPFRFNLTDEAHAKALGDPAGFLDSLKRPFDRELSKAGIRLPYWFAIDITPEGRLHIQGAFGAYLDEHPALRQIMWKAWGPWQKHRQFQIWVGPVPCDDGWATYCMRNQRKVAKIIGPRTFTLTQPLGREARSVYTEIRRIMRGRA